MKTLKVKRLSEHATLPTRSYDTDAGLDLYVVDDYDDFYADANSVTLVDTDIAVMVPKGYVGLIRDRSSVSKIGLKVTAGVVDHGYKGHVQVAIINTTNKDIHIMPKQKIAQLLIIPIETPIVEEVKDFEETERGTKGWGSSGV